jgi:hypothetical protein
MKHRGCSQRNYLWSYRSSDLPDEAHFLDKLPPMPPISAWGTSLPSTGTRRLSGPFAHAGGRPMNGGANLADRVRDKISANLLPHEHPEKTGTRHGAGDPCAVCDEPIQPAQVEYWIGPDTNITHRFTSAASGSGRLRCFAGAGLSRKSAPAWRARFKQFAPSCGRTSCR